MKKVFINIKNIYGTYSQSTERVEGKDMSILPSIDNAFIEVENGNIKKIGKMSEYIFDNCEVIDLLNSYVYPCYADSHTHIVFAKSREEEFEMKIKGYSYQQIAENGGGIVNSAKKLQNTEYENLISAAKERIRKMILMGTGAIEIKSGYGLSIEAEIKMLKVIEELKNKMEIPIKSTFLGAHAIPKEYKTTLDYIKKVIFPSIDIIGSEKLADYIDIFIEKNYFSIEDAKMILDYSSKYSMIPKLHVNQLNNFGALQFAVDYNSLSVDHLEEIGQNEIDYLKNKKTIATTLPLCSFFIKIPYTPSRKIIDNGLPLAIATDYNPGSTPSGNMNFAISVACIYQHITPIEAFNAATLNGAYAMNLQSEVGSITVGKKANFWTSKDINSPTSIAYNFAMNIVDKVYINGNKV